MADFGKTLLQALLGSSASPTAPYTIAAGTPPPALPAAPMGQVPAAANTTLKSIQQQVSPTAPPPGSNTLAGMQQPGAPPAMAGNPVASAQAQPVPQAAPPTQGALNPWGIAGQIIGGIGQVRKPVNIANAFGFGADNQSDDEQPSGDMN